jgi:cytochrome P450
MWALKRLSKNQDSQHDFRGRLHELFPDAHRGGRPPSPEEIGNSVGKREACHLDAFVEECVRTAAPLSLVFREAMTDTTILGVPIPKGTQIIMPCTGPGFTQAGYADKIPEDMRSASSQKRANLVSKWDDADVEMFKPSRWLKKNSEGQEVFDAHAGPVYTFSSGVRGCWGRRLAYLELRIVLVILFWHFQFLPVDPTLNGDAGEDGLAFMPKQCYVRLQLVAHQSGSAA